MPEPESGRKIFGTTTERVQAHRCRREAQDSVVRSVQERRHHSPPPARAKLRRCSPAQDPGGGDATYSPFSLLEEKSRTIRDKRLLVILTTETATIAGRVLQGDGRSTSSRAPPVVIPQQSGQLQHKHSTVGLQLKGSWQGIKQLAPREAPAYC